MLLNKIKLGDVLMGSILTGASIYFGYKVLVGLVHWHMVAGR